MQTLYVATGLAFMLDEGSFQIFRLSGVGHLRQRLEDFIFGEIDVLERVVK
jgi:hypothetical protein